MSRSALSSAFVLAGGFRASRASGRGAWALRRVGVMLAVALVLAAGSGAAVAQMTIPTAGKLPPEGPSRSYILGDALEMLRAGWAKPVNPQQASWKQAIDGRAAGGIAPDAPAKFADASLVSSIAKAAAFRWAMDPKAGSAAADRAKALAALKVAAVAGGTEITRNEPATSYLMAYDFLRLEPIAPADDAVIRERLAPIARSLGGGDSDSNVRGKVGATRALAGLLLRDQALLNQGLTELRNHFVYSTTDDGWFTDSQGHYLNYTLSHLAPFVRAYHQASGVNLYPNVRPYLDMSMGLRMPDGRVPCVGNGTNQPVGIHLFACDPDPIVAGIARWHILNLPTDAFAFSNIMNNDWTPTSFFALCPFPAEGAAPAMPPQSPTYHSPGQAGVSVFRQNWNPTSDFLAVSAGVDSPPQARALPQTLGMTKGLFPAYHTHNDTGAFFIGSGGKLVLTSSGYDRRDLKNTPKDFDPKRSDWHNVLLVDGNVGTLPDPSGSFAYGENPIEYGGPNRGRTVRPVDFAHADRLDSAEMGDFKGVCDLATLLTAYNGAKVRRTVAFPHEEYFVIADAAGDPASSPSAAAGPASGNDAKPPAGGAGSPRDYAFNLIGRGEQSVIASTPELVQAKWEVEGRQVIAHVVSSAAMSTASASLWLHDRYNTFEPTKRLLTSVKAPAAAFLCVVETAPAGSPARLSVKRSASNSLLTLEVADAAAGWSDAWVNRLLPTRGHDKAAGAAAGASGQDGAEVVYVRKVAGAVQSAAIVHGRTAGPLAPKLLQASAPMTLSLRLSDKEIRATISPDGLTKGAKLAFPGRNASAATLNGKPLPVQKGADGSTVELPGPGSLVITLAP